MSNPQPFCPFGLPVAPRHGYGRAPASLTGEAKAELDYRLGLWRAAKGKPHEPNAAPASQQPAAVVRVTRKSPALRALIEERDPKLTRAQRRKEAPRG